MLDSDLANLYEVETKRINKTVKNNVEKISIKYSWILNEEEWEILRSKFSIKKETRGFRFKNLRVFTEHGIKYNIKIKSCYCNKVMNL